MLRKSCLFISKRDRDFFFLPAPTLLEGHRMMRELLKSVQLISTFSIISYFVPFLHILYGSGSLFFVRPRLFSIAWIKNLPCYIILICKTWLKYRFILRWCVTCQCTDTPAVQGS